MITEDEKKLLKTMMLGTVPILFLGAGFSVGSKSKTNTMDGKGLKEYILDTLVRPKVNDIDYDEIKGYDLRKVCEEVYTIYKGKKELTDLLTTCFSQTVPDGNKFHLKLTSYPWKRIYTVNIDDLVENVYKEKNKNYFVQNKTKLVPEPDDCPVLYKLHGCVNNPSEGYIFSDSEYTDLTTKRIDARMNRFADELLNNNVIFIGASMDEPDIKYYLNLYESSGCKYRSNRIVFINKTITRSLRGIAQKLNAILIESTAEEFLEFVESLNYNPDEIKKAIINLNYNGVYRLNDLERLFITPYESKIYSGNFCTWQDAADGWIAETETFIEAVTKLNIILKEEHPVSCLSIYGAMFSGKSCLLKNLGYHLLLKGFDVLEYRGKYLNRDAIWKYIKESVATKFALIIDGGAYYYEQIEKMFNYPIPNKEVIIITAAREYYHKKKRYYLDGNPYVEYKISSTFLPKDAEIIVSKLDEKSHLSFLASLKREEQIAYVYKRHNIINLLVALTYGNIASRISEEYRKFPLQSRYNLCPSTSIKHFLVSISVSIK